MASKTTLNAKNLIALGAPQLADILIEISTGQSHLKRRLRLELLAKHAPQQAASEIAKRLTELIPRKNRMSAKAQKPYFEELKFLRRAIVEKIGPHDPKVALELIWRFMGLTLPVTIRWEGNVDAVFALFELAGADIGPLALAAQPDPEALVEPVFEALSRNRYGQYDAMLPAITSLLGAAGLSALRARFEAVLDRHTQPGPKDSPRPERKFMQAHIDLQDKQAAQRALRRIADAQGDVDGYIRHTDPQTRRDPDVTLEIVARLKAAGRGKEALDYLDAVELGGRTSSRIALQDARLDVLETMGAGKAAQEFRWACFEKDLSARYLRAYLGKLPAFEDIDEEERALAMVMADPRLPAALQFCLEWRAPGRAVELIYARHSELDGAQVEALEPIVEALAPAHPLAATVLLRVMIEFVLHKNRRERYGYAAGQLGFCAELAEHIEDFGAFETHETYLVRLKTQYEARPGFWTQLKLCGYP